MSGCTHKGCKSTGHMCCPLETEFTMTGQGMHWPGNWGVRAPGVTPIEGPPILGLSLEAKLFRFVLVANGLLKHLALNLFVSPQPVGTGFRIQRLNQLARQQGAFSFRKMRKCPETSRLPFPPVLSLPGSFCC